MLTEQEQKAIKAAGRLYSQVVKIIKEGGDDAIVRADAAELAFHIHGIQNMILAQSAAREYSGEYRLMGSRLRKVEK